MNGDNVIVEGGPVEQTGEIRVKGPFDADRHRGLVTNLLIGFLALLVVGHHACVFIMEWNGKKSDSLNGAFNAALPTVSGLVGSAVAYYFTKRN